MLSFFPIRKVKLWNSWLVNQDLPEAFTCLGNCPSLLLREERIVIERLIIPLCYDNSYWFSTDLVQYEILMYQQNIDILFYHHQKMF